MNQGEVVELPLSSSNQRCYSRLWAVQGRGRNPYTVSIKSSGADVGAFGCSCPDWAKHFPRQDCKHIMKIKLEVLHAFTVIPKAGRVIFNDGYGPFPTPAPATACLQTSTGRKFRS